VYVLLVGASTHTQGPGLAIRIIGDVTQDKLEILREADLILIDELHKAGIYREIAQVRACVRACVASDVCVCSSGCCRADRWASIGHYMTSQHAVVRVEGFF
jgi:GMP synthase PP-ATPase subunit